MSPGSSILIRADANPQIGTGHVMRCLALAQAWQDAGGTAVFASRALPTGIRARLESERVDVVQLAGDLSEAQDAQQTSEIALKLGADWVVADGYGFGEVYQRAVQNSGLKLLFLDDYGHARHYCANLVLNQNANAGESLYANHESHTRLLLGTRFAMLRREFLAWREWKRKFPETARNVLVTMGGADPDNTTRTIVLALAQVALPGLHSKIILGPANPHGDVIRSEIENSGRDFELILSCNDMPQVMAWADLAISAAGSTLWELQFMQVPVIAICIAGNQRANADKMRGEAGGAVHFPAHGTRAIMVDLLRLALSQPTRAWMGGKGREIVDGEGTRRVVASLRAWDGSS